MKKDTKVVHAGHNKKRNAGAVNTPVVHASTIIFDRMADLREVERKAAAGERVMSYGRRGTPTHWTLQEALTELAGGAETVLVPSGLCAGTTVILACVKAGDHILASDSIYGPTRDFCTGFMARFGVETTFYDPLIGGGIAGLMRPSTTLVLCESPGSLTFEVQDIPAIAAAAKKRNAVVAIDNTWATPLYCRPLKLGVDLVIEAATKYIVGHSDAMMGAITGTAEAIERVKKTNGALGLSVAPDDVYLATRGLRTLGARLDRHQASALKIARWLQTRPEIKRVLYPALPEDPGYALWKRDFSGASGLLGMVFKETSQAAVEAMLEGMDFFALGYSWGGFESLIAPLSPKRTAVPWREPSPGIRIHVGLEDVDDLIADLDKALSRFRKALGAS